MASLEPFISRQDLTDYLGPDVTKDEGALAVVDAACDICRNISGQSFNQVFGDTITLDGNGIDSLLLPEFPATNAGTVVIQGGTAVVGEYVLDTHNGLLILTAGATPGWGWPSNEWFTPWAPWATPGIWTPIGWPKGRQNITVTYDHGYAPEDMPRDVRMVALSIASRLIVQGVASKEKMGRDVEITYGTNATDLTAGEKAILNNYRREGH